MKISRRMMLLVELLIAMILTMGILTIMMIFYDQVDRANSALEKEQNISFRKLYLSTRLAAVIPKAIGFNNSEKDAYFFTSNAIDTFAKPGSSSLVFAFDNGVKLDSIFSNHVIGRLYVNQKSQLCLAVWPSPKRWNNFSLPPMKNEILYDNVDSLSFNFFVPPAKDRQLILQNNQVTIAKNENVPMELDGDWKTEWEQEYKDLPAIIRINVDLLSKESEQPLVLVYPLPKSHLIILYDR